MKFALQIVVISFFACMAKTGKTLSNSPTNPLFGTWQLVSGTIIEKGDTSVTNYTNNKTSFLKIINNTHFAYLKHDLNKGKDSTAVFVSGGGSYSLKDSSYKEHLEFCSARNWEGNDFDFTIKIEYDTLIQSGVEKVADAAVDRVNIERYIRVKK